ncbi:DUF2750 domain-containing protein [Marinobacter salicampi]|uniref:DUF2750 domain-containing protein n=1 Tax=Marinobacter salicampi TaxID=435907 RepID=UPI00140E3E36|nr:DUF2750 domain-containing protein [Marinobacter salicampi]
MNTDELKYLLDLNGEERYDYFLSQVADTRDIWILINAENRFLKIVSEEDGVEYVPVWPAREFAADYAGGSGGLTPKSISLPDFFKKWVPGLSRDGLEVGVFPGADKTVWITGPEELNDDLKAELSNF